MVTTLYEKTLNKSVIVLKYRDVEADELQKICNYCPDKGKVILKNTEISNHEIDSGFLGKVISGQQITKFDTFSAKMMSILVFIKVLFSINLKRI